jgi:hypothetical protein
VARACHFTGSASGRGKILKRPDAKRRSRAGARWHLRSLRLNAVETEGHARAPGGPLVQVAPVPGTPCLGEARCCVGTSQDWSGVVLAHPRSQNKQRDGYVGWLTKKDSGPSCQVDTHRVRDCSYRTLILRAHSPARQRISVRRVRRHYGCPFGHRLIFNIRPRLMA